MTGTGNSFRLRPAALGMSSQSRISLAAWWRRPGGGAKMGQVVEAWEGYFKFGDGQCWGDQCAT
jgi:hypothetical protein